jgi:hypothetical protein
MATAEQEYLETRKQARGTQESANDQPENTEAVDVSQDAPVEEVITEEAQADEEVTTETEESEITENSQDENSDAESDLLYYEFDGEEISSDQIKEWKSGSMMQADYTRGKQGIAEDRKALDSEKEEFNVKQSEFNDKLAQLNAMIEEDTPSAETLAEWREYEPEKYIEHTEKMSNRKKLLASSKAELPVQGVDMAKVSADLFAAHPEWMVDGKQSKQFTDDTNLMTAYADSRGIGQAELSSFDARHYEIMLDAARYRSQNSKNVAIEKKVRKAPVSTKPRAKATHSLQDEIKTVQTRYNKTGSDKDFLLLRKLNRQL